MRRFRKTCLYGFVWVFTLWFAGLNLSIGALHNHGPQSPVCTCFASGQTGMLSYNSFRLHPAPFSDQIARYMCMKQSQAPMLARAASMHPAGPCLACMYLSNPQIPAAIHMPAAIVLPLVSSPEQPEGLPVTSDSFQRLHSRAPPSVVL